MSTRKHAPILAGSALACSVLGCSGPAFALPGSVVRPTVRSSELSSAGAPNLSSQSAASRAHVSAAATLPVFAVAAALGAAHSRRSKLARNAQNEKVVIDDVCEHSGISLTRYLMELSKLGHIDEDLVSVLDSIREASKVIAKLVNTAPLRQAEMLGYEGAVNVQGEDQKKLDVITNDIFKKALRYTGKLGTLASEEEDTPVVGVNGESIGNLSEGFADTGKYVCVFDPLDGSSNVDAGIPVGTIWGVFREPNKEECNLPDDISTGMNAEQMKCLAGTLQPGKDLVCAGYVLYSSSTEMVITVGRGVVGFTLDTSIGEFVLTRPEIQIPKRGKIYSCNQANIGEWDEPMRNYIRDIQNGRGETGKAYSLRYIGSMVGDIHRTLLYGGIFAYPADSKNLDGKLRLLYEGAPMSFIMEQAGGKAITGHSRVLEIPPVKVHQRVPVILGSADDVDECKKYFDKSTDPALKARCEQRMRGLGTVRV